MEPINRRDPSKFADLTSLEVLNLSHNHLVGRIPKGKQFNTFEEYSFGGNSGLCGFPLPKHREHLSSPQLEADKDEDIGFTWKVVMLGFGCGTLVGLAMGFAMLSTGKPKWFSAIASAGRIHATSCLFCIWSFFGRTFVNVVVY